MGSHLSRTAATWKSYLISSQDPIPPGRNYCERAVAKETGSSAAERNQSRIEETHALQELVLANPVCFVKETIPTAGDAQHKNFGQPKAGKKSSALPASPDGCLVAVWWRSGSVTSLRPPLSPPPPPPSLPPLPPRNNPTRRRAPEKESTKRTSADVGQNVDEKCTEIFETHTVRVAHEVHAHWLGSTHGLKQYVTTMTISNACPMCEPVFFSNLVTARIHVVQAFRSGKCLMNQSARA